MNYNKEAFRRGIDKIANIVGSTMGANGKTVLIQTDTGGIHITKDGVSVAKAMYSNEPTEDVAIQLIQKVAINAESKGGDGTTAAVVLSQELLNKLDKVSTEGDVNMTLLQRGMLEAYSEIEKVLTKSAKKVRYSKKSISDVATISCNNDRDLGDLIAEAFVKAGKNSSITISGDTAQLKDKYEHEQGYKINQGVNKFFIPVNRTSNTLALPYVALVDYDVKGNNDFMRLAKAFVDKNPDIDQAEVFGRPIVFICRSVTDDIIVKAASSYLQGNSNMIVVGLPQFAISTDEIMEDLEVVLQTKKNTITDQGYINQVDEISVTLDDVTIINNNESNEALTTLINILQEEKEEAKPEAKKLLERRISKLTGGVVTLFLSGTSYQEYMEKRDRVEDTLNSVKAALDKGVVAGGGVALRDLYKQIEGTTDCERGRELVYSSLNATFNKILSNADLDTDNYNFGVGEGINVLTGEKVEMVKEGIVDPVKIILNSLKNAISIVGNVATVGGIILADQD